jgi:amidase
MPTDLSFLPVSQIATLLRSGEITSVELVEAQLERIEQFNPSLNAIVTLNTDQARLRANEVDQAAKRGEWWGPLHGIPITIKDSFETAGLRTVSGYPPFAQHIPLEDAVAVARLRLAGAIILGKTNLPTLASGIQTNNPVFGRTNNPWDLSRTPGGSSGGAAASIAAGLSFLELGSDIGGSIRIPSHFCGVFGLKMTSGRVSGKGHLSSPNRLSLPSGWEDLIQLASFGPLARSVEDLRLSFEVLSNVNTPGMELQPALPINDIRLAWSDDFGGAPLSVDSRLCMQQLAANLAKEGVHLERITDPGFDFQETWYMAGVCLGAINTLFQSQTTRWLRRIGSPILSRVGPHDPLLRGLSKGMSLNPTSVTSALEFRAKLIEDLEEFLNGWDAWICPIFPTSAFTHRASNAPIEVDDSQVSQLTANLLHNIIFNLTGHPAVAIPIGLSSQGLPIGVQVVGRRNQEIALLNTTEQIIKSTQGYQSPPGY